MRILEELTDLSRQESAQLLDRSGKRVKLALLMHWAGVDAEAGQLLLDHHQGNLRAALQTSKNS